MTLEVKAISALPLATTAAGADQVILNKANPDGSFTTDRITTSDLAAGSAFIGQLQGNKVNLTHALSPYTMGASDEFLICDTTGGNIAITFVGATAHKLPGVTVLMSAGTGSVTTMAAGSDTIVGGGPIVFTGQAYVYKSNLVSKWYAT